MIVLDTTVLVYATGTEHPAREPSRALIDQISRGGLEATTTTEVIQEFAHVRARRRDRADAVRLARDLAELLSPLLAVGREELEGGLRLFAAHPELGAFDAVLAAAAIEAGAEALVSADRAFSGVAELNHVIPGEDDQLARSSDLS